MGKIKSHRIINIRGANGSGKSWIVRQLLKDQVPTTLVHTPGRTMHVGEFYNEKELFVLGPYVNRARNGGFDTLLLAEGYRILNENVSKADCVLYEGKNQSDDLMEMVAMGAFPIFLSTLLDSCVQRVRARGHTLSRSVIERTYRKQYRDMERLSKMGVTFALLGSDDALEYIRNTWRLSWTS